MRFPTFLIVAFHPPEDKDLEDAIFGIRAEFLIIEQIEDRIRQYCCARKI